MKIKASLPRIEIKRSENGEWYWRYLAKNGKQISRSSETNKRIATVQRSVQIMKGSGDASIITIK